MLLRTPLLASAFGLLVAFVVGAPAAGAPDVTSYVLATSTPAAANTVSIVLKDGKMAASVKATSAGKVTFAIKNSGKQRHQFIVIRSNLHHHLLPTTGKTANLAGVKGKTKVGRNSTKRLTLNLAPGKYVLICNEPGHYKRGEYLAFTVKAGATTPVEPKTTEVDVSMFEMGFKLSRTTVPRGTVVFHVKNDGKLPHDFSFGSRGGGSPLLQPGQSTKFTVEFTKAGKYTYICTVEGHYAAGMYGVLTVL
jgi:uncharacterized cupredoxin-like copper-binding protein